MRETARGNQSFLTWNMSKYTRVVASLGVLSLLCAACVPAHANAFQSTISPPISEARWNRFSAGVNVPFWFSEPKRTDLESLKKWTNVGEIKAWREIGLTHIRIPFIAESLATSYEDARFDPEKIRFLKQTLNEFKKNNLMVILDFHPGDPFKRKLKGNPREVQQLRNFWGGLARELRDSDPEFVSFELLNEPNLGAADEWWAIQRVLMAEVRSVAPNHTIVVEADRWTAIDEMITRTPYADKNVVYAVHFYEPFIFTHQGATWVDKELGGWKDVGYPSSPANIDSLRTQSRSQRQNEILQRFESEGWGPAQLNRRVKVLGDWATRHGAKVIINEFGTIRLSTAPAARAAWTRDARRAFEDNGFGWSHYDWRGGMGLTYANITTKDGYETAQMPMFDALGLQRPKRP